MDTLEYILDYDIIASKIASRKESLFCKIENDVRETILKMPPSQALSFRICRNTFYEEVPMAADKRYAKVLWAFLHNNKYSENNIAYEVESNITFPILNQVEASILDFYSSKEVKECIVTAISEAVQTSKIVQSAVGNSVKESRKAIRNELAAKIAK